MICQILMLQEILVAVYSNVTPLYKRWQNVGVLTPKMRFSVILMVCDTYNLVFELHSIGYIKDLTFYHFSPIVLLIQYYMSSHVRSSIFPLGFNNNIYHEGNIYKMPDFNVFLFWTVTT